MTIEKARNIIYKGYSMKVDYDEKDNVFYGRVDIPNDFVSFEANALDEICDQFCDAVDGYLAFCAEVGKDPEHKKWEEVGPHD